MLHIESVRLLAQLLETNTSLLIRVANDAPSYYKELLLLDPEKPDKPRDIHRVTGILRRYQSAMYSKLLIPRHRPSLYSHGGVPGRSIKTNAASHKESIFVYTTDVANFYPSISHQRIYRLFAGDFDCSPDVARICTKLCTHQGHLALGLITSPLLADRLMMGVDRRIGIMCTKHNFAYSRFVDDITISSKKHRVESGSFMKIVVEMLGINGFSVNPKKHEQGYGRLDDEGKHITKLRIKRGRLDISKEYLEKVSKQIEDAARLANGEAPIGNYYAPAQIRGRIHYIDWINPGRARPLMRKFKSLDHKRVEEEALARKLVATRIRLIQKPINGCPFIQPQVL